VRLVIESAFLARGGEVFVTKMPVIRIKDLAHVMIEELAPRYGFDPVDIKIENIGSKPGEKLYEELLIGDDVSATEHKKIMRAEEAIIPWQQLDEILQQLQQANDSYDCQQVRDILLAHVNGFKPQCGIEDWLG